MTPLRYAREKLGISKLKLSQMADVWPTQITRIENGRPAPREVAKKLIACVGEHITLLDLLCPEDFVAPKTAKGRRAA
jgi:transcriptional regulator with XRE-family HTH domain